MAEVNNGTMEPAFMEGNESKYVKFTANDGKEFLMARKNGNVSGTITAMLAGCYGAVGEEEEEEDKQEQQDDSGKDEEINLITFDEVPSHILNDVCRYLQYKVRYTNSAAAIPEFIIPDQNSLELLMAANFLDC